MQFSTKRIALALSAAGLLALSGSASATGIPVVDGALNSQVAQLAIFLQQWKLSIANSFSNLVNAVDAAASKIVDAIGQNAKGQIDADNQRTKDWEDVKTYRRYEQPVNPCATGGAAATADGVARQARTWAFGQGPRAFRADGLGSGNTPADAMAASDSDAKTAFARAMRVNAVHASTYCDPSEASVYSGSKVCPSVGNRPGADSSSQSLFAGSPDGVPSKTAPSPLTYNDQQKADAQAYIANLNADYANNPTPLPRETYNTEAGIKYAAQVRQLRAITDLGLRPVMDEYAGHLPVGGQELIDALQSSAAAPASARAIYSKLSANGGIGLLDLLEAETVRRFRNPSWYVAMSAASPEAIAREQLYVSASQLEMQFQIMRAIQTMAAINGTHLNLTARTTLQPGIRDALVAASNARVAGNN